MMQYNLHIKAFTIGFRQNPDKACLPYSPGCIGLVKGMNGESEDCKITFSILYHHSYVLLPWWMGATPCVSPPLLLVWPPARTNRVCSVKGRRGGKKAKSQQPQTCQNLKKKKSPSSFLRISSCTAPPPPPHSHERRAGKKLTW